MDEPTLREILPTDIVFNAGTQARIQTDHKTVQSYAESMRDGIEFPPIDVFSDGQSGQCILADGFHRYTAHLSIRPNEMMKCLVHEGDVADARIFACGANVKHGLRRTNEDKRKAVQIILQEPKCQEWSNRKIANHVSVSEALVRTICAKLELTMKKTHLTGKRVGKDGKFYPVKTYAFGENPLHIRENSVKCKLYPKNPQLSACEIRAELGEEFLLDLQQAITAITKECCGR
jgi:hypothetical protein